MNLEQIDTSTTAGKIEVMRLAAEGRRVAYSAKSAPHWSPALPDPDYFWNWVACDFAIIAEPVGPEQLWAVLAGEDVMHAFQDPAEVATLVKRGAKLAHYIRSDLIGHALPDPHQ